MDVDMTDGGEGGEGGAAASAAASLISRQLLVAAAAAEGLSGRSLRKLPFLTHAAAQPPLPLPCPMLRFLKAIATVAASEKEERKAICSGESTGKT